MSFEIKLGDLSLPEVHDFLVAHAADMHSASPPCSVYVLNVDELAHPQVQFWTIWDGGVLVGCGALKELDPQTLELKSMRTAPEYRGQGVGSILMKHLLKQAHEHGAARIYLETGPGDFFLPARRLYENFGFRPSEAFGDYPADDPHLAFYRLDLSSAPVN